MIQRVVLLLASTCLFVACETGGAPTGTQSNASPDPVPTEKAVAFINGQAVSWADLRPQLLETAGGQLLTEIALDRDIDKRLARRGVTLSTTDIERERATTLAELDPDPDTAQRLLNEIRRRNNVGDQRYARQLRRNAGLRLLVQDDVEVPDAAVQQEYERRFGTRYETRLIVVDRLDQAADMARRARGGESFIDLAVRNSSDASSFQGGYLGILSPLDPRLGDALRSALRELPVGAVSNPVSVEDGYAILKVERKIEGGEVAYDDVKNDLTQQVRRRLETVRMQQLARTILAEANVVVLDPQLNAGWERERPR